MKIIRKCQKNVHVWTLWSMNRTLFLMSYEAEVLRKQTQMLQISSPRDDYILIVNKRLNVCRLLVFARRPRFLEYSTLEKLSTGFLKKKKKTLYIINVHSQHDALEYNTTTYSMYTDKFRVRTIYFRLRPTITYDNGERRVHVRTTRDNDGRPFCK